MNGIKILLLTVCLLFPAFAKAQWISKTAYLAEQSGSPISHRVYSSLSKCEADSGEKCFDGRKQKTHRPQMVQKSRLLRVEKQGSAPCLDAAACAQAVLDLEASTCTGAGKRALWGPPGCESGGSCEAWCAVRVMEQYQEEDLVADPSIVIPDPPQVVQRKVRRKRLRDALQAGTLTPLQEDLVREILKE